MRRTSVAGALGLVAMAVALVALPSSSADPSVVTAGCPAGSVAARIEGKPVCLRRGQRCKARLDRQYHRFGFHCHAGRLTGGPKPPGSPTRPAGSVVATIRVPSTGGIAVGAGSVWVANTLEYTVSRVDPGTNTVIATIPTGRSPGDLFHGPTRVAIGHGSAWVPDGRADCSCLHRIDPSSNTIVATIRLGTPVFSAFRLAPLGIAVTADAVWVALRHGREEDALSGSVVRVDPSTNEVTTVIPLGSSTDGGGPTGIAASGDSVWVATPSTRELTRIGVTSRAVVATVPRLTCGEGELAADEAGAVWVADCDAVRRVDPAANAITLAVKIPSPALSNGVRGLAVGLGSVWAQSDVLTRLDPATGARRGALPLDPALVWGEYSVATGFGSVWVRQIDRVVRIAPS